MSQRSSMLDLVRRTCDGARAMDDFEGEYEPDPKQVEEWQAKETETYKGEWRYVNLPPTVVRRRLQSETDESEIAALRTAEGFWGMKNGFTQTGWTEAGWVDRGEDIGSVRASSMSELAANVKPVASIRVMGELGAGGIPRRGEPVSGETYVDRGVIDWALLMDDAGPVSEDEDWF